MKSLLKPKRKRIENVLQESLLQTNHDENGTILSPTRCRRYITEIDQALLSPDRSKVCKVLASLWWSFLCQISESLTKLHKFWVEIWGESWQISAVLHVALSSTRTAIGLRTEHLLLMISIVQNLPWLAVEIYDILSVSRNEAKFSAVLHGCSKVSGSPHYYADREGARPSWKSDG